MKRFFLTLFVLGTALFGTCFLTFASADEDTAAKFASLLPKLSSTDLEELGAAQQELQSLCASAGAPGLDQQKEELNALMAEQLPQPIDPIAKTWILFQLGRTGTDNEVDAMALLLNDPDFRVRQQALRSLAQIRTDKAVDALKKGAEKAEDKIKDEIEATLKVLVYDFTIPAETEWPLCLPHASDSEVDAWMAGYENLDVTAKARTLAALTVRGDRKYRPYVLEAIAADDPDLKRDGLLALEKLGTVDDLPIILEYAKKPEWERIVLIAADRIEYPGFDEALLTAIRSEKNAEDFCNLVKILVARYNKAALPEIFKGAQKWSESRTWLLSSAGFILDKEDLPQFIQLMLTIKTPADREELEKIVMKVAEGDASPVTALLNDTNRAALLPLIGRIGGEEGVKVLSASLESSNRAVRDGAVKGLCNAPNALFADKLLVLAQDPKMPAASRVAALRAYIRVISLPYDQIGIEITEKEQLAALQNAFQVSWRDDEKNLVLDRVKAVRIPESLAYVLPFTDDPVFSDTATATVLELAHHDFLRKSDPEAFAAALDKLISKGGDPDRIDEAKRYREAIK